MSSSKPLRVGVIGPAGFGGSYLCVELLNRGHTVIGISRNPEKLGKHERYIPRPVDIDQVSTDQLAKTFDGIDVLVSEYGPHTAGAGALLYSTWANSSSPRLSADEPSSAFPRNRSQANTSLQAIWGLLPCLCRWCRQSTCAGDIRNLRRPS